MQIERHSLKSKNLCHPVVELQQYGIPKVHIFDLF